MITLSGPTFQSIATKIEKLNQEIKSLTIELNSDFDAPAIFLNAPFNPAISNQPLCLTNQLQFNPYLKNLQHLVFKCKFTLNRWQSLTPFVKALNSKLDDFSCHFITSKQITEDSFIHHIKNCSSEIKQW